MIQWVYFIGIGWRRVLWLARAADHTERND